MQEEKHCYAVVRRLNSFAGIGKIKTAATMISDAQNVFICGNGGDAILASHFAVDLMKFGRIAAWSLANDIAMTTMIANDFGYEQTFSYQLIKYATCNDLLICLSTSGASPNILAAAKMAYDLGMKIIAIIGARGAEQPQWQKCATVIIAPGE